MSHPAGKILVVDDEPQIARLLRAGLTANGYEVTAAATGEQALGLLAIRHFDLLLLDLGLPGIDGLEVCRSLRSWSSLPILILSVQDREEEKIAALDLGADDYVTKPFSMGELLARVRAALRHAAQREGSPPAVLALGELTLDLVQRRVTRAGQPVHLSPTEYALLDYLARNAGRILTHRAILRHVWGPEYGEETQYLRVYIRHLRQKIEPNPAHPRYILTEPAVGYRFQAAPPPSGSDINDLSITS
jgi:two-component system KDP operon response regulator KdpE